MVEVKPYASIRLGIARICIPWVAYMRGLRLCRGTHNALSNTPCHHCRSSGHLAGSPGDAPPPLLGGGRLGGGLGHSSGGVAQHAQRLCCTRLGVPAVGPAFLMPTVESLSSCLAASTGGSGEK